MALQNRRYTAKNMRRGEYTHLNHVHITENMTVGRLFVAGDLTVDGDLSVDTIFCLGRLTVGGGFAANYAHLGACMEVAGAVEVDCLSIGHPDGVIARLFSGIQDIGDASAQMWKGVHRDVINNYRRLVNIYQPGVAPALTAPSLVSEDVYVKGSAWVSGAIETGYIEVTVNLQAGQIDSETSVRAGGILACTGDMTVGEECRSQHLICGGHLRVDALIYGTSDVTGSVEAASIRPGGELLLPAA